MNKRTLFISVLIFLGATALGATILSATGLSESTGQLQALSEAQKERAYLEAKKLELKPICDELVAVEDSMTKIDEKIDKLLDGDFKEAAKPQTTELTGNFKSSEGGIASFLEVNAAGFVKGEEDLFISAGKLYNIKPELLVCIAQADSSLGNALKSTNNIGNVGNNDRGDTKHFDSLGLAIAGIGETLNNKYLKGNTMIGQLSQGGRDIMGTKYDCSKAPSPFKCYATSKFNWNKNVKLCLQDILQDKTIDEKWEFRTK